MTYFDIRQSPEYAEFMSHAGWLVERLKNGQYAYIRKLGPLGSIIKIQRFNWPVDLEEVEGLASKHRAWLVKLEPSVVERKLPRVKFGYSLAPSFVKRGDHPLFNKEREGVSSTLKAHGFKQDKWPLIPPSTLVMNLTKSEQQLLKEGSESMRRNLKIARSNLKVKVGDWEWFYDHWRQAANIQKLVIPDKRNFGALFESFGDNLKLISCTHAKYGWAGGVVLVLTESTGYYYYASASRPGKQLRSPYLAAWTAIRIAKATGCQWFDWDGIADDRFKSTNNAAWQGFTDFKVKFGGEKVQYVGSFSKYYGIGKILEIMDKVFN